METRPGQPLEGRLIEEARERLGLSQNKAAKRAGMSGTRWRQIVYGEASGGPGIRNPVHGNAETTAKMGNVVGLTPDDLRRAGRDDAARELELLLEDEPEASTVIPELDDHLRRVLELWPELVEWQRRSLAGIAQEMISDTKAVHRTERPVEEQRRTG